MRHINIISTNYFLNSFFPTILMCIYFLYDEKIRAEIGVLSSLVIVLLNIFSSNKKKFDFSFR